MGAHPSGWGLRWAPGSPTTGQRQGGGRRPGASAHGPQCGLGVGTACPRTSPASVQIGSPPSPVSPALGVVCPRPPHLSGPTPESLLPASPPPLSSLELMSTLQDSDRQPLLQAASLSLPHPGVPQSGVTLRSGAPGCESSLSAPQHWARLPWGYDSHSVQAGWWPAGVVIGEHVTGLSSVRSWGCALRRRPRCAWLPAH